MRPLVVNGSRAWLQAQLPAATQIQFECCRGQSGGPPANHAEDATSAYAMLQYAPIACLVTYNQNFVVFCIKGQ